MTDLLARLRNTDTTRRIGESYADTHERRQRDREEAAARIAQLEAALREIAAMDYFHVCENPEEPMIKARAALEERT